MAYRRLSKGRNTSELIGGSNLRGATATLSSTHQGNNLQINSDNNNSSTSHVFDRENSRKITITNKKRNFCSTLKLWEVAILTLVAVLFYCVYFYHDIVHFHILRTYAWAGYDEAQQLVGQRYALGEGVKQHTGKAMEYFKMAADQGHPKASHNLALGHVMRHVKLERGEARKLLNHASEHGVSKADIVLDIYCDKKGTCND